MQIIYWHFIRLKVTIKFFTFCFLKHKKLSKPLMVSVNKSVVISLFEWNFVTSIHLIAFLISGLKHVTARHFCNIHKMRLLRSSLYQKKREIVLKQVNNICRTESTVHMKAIFLDAENVFLFLLCCCSSSIFYTFFFVVLKLPN